MKDTDPSPTPACLGNTLAAKQTPGAAGAGASRSHIHNPVTDTEADTDGEPRLASLAAASCLLAQVWRAGRRDLISPEQPWDTFTPRSLACCLFISEARAPDLAGPSLRPWLVSGRPLRFAPFFSSPLHLSRPLLSSPPCFSLRPLSCLALSSPLILAFHLGPSPVSPSPLLSSLLFT